MNATDQEEIIRRQLTPIVVPLVERLQQADISAKNIRRSHEDTSEVMKAFRVWLSEFLEEAKNSIARDAQSRKQMAKRLEDLGCMFEAAAKGNERMLRIPAEPSGFWWGIILGWAIGAAVMLCAYIYLAS